MKRLALLFILAAGLQFAHAQKKRNVYHLKENGDRVSKDSADLTRIIEEPDSGSTYFVLKEFYPNGQPRALGKLSAFDPQLIYEGELIRYDKNGKKCSVVNYRDNRPVGKAHYFFSDGRTSRLVDFDGVTVKQHPETIQRTMDDYPFRMIYLADSLNNVLVKDGNGHYKMPLKMFSETIVEEGDYVDGLKEGLWKGKSTSSDLWYNEQFQKGNLISGESFRNGESYTYTFDTEQPVFKGGMQKFYRYVGANVVYPRIAYKNKVTGKVFLSFVIEKDGTVADVKVSRGVSKEIDEEAVRVLSRSPKWVSGKHHGIPVRVKYNIPLSFSLN